MPNIDDPRLVEERILEALYRRDTQATIADLVVDTGAPARVIEESLERLSREYHCYEAVTEEGDILYRLRRTDDRPGPDRRALNLSLSETRGVSRNSIRNLMKRAPLLAMAGYFAFFLTIPFPPALVFLAILLSSWTDIDLLDFNGEPHERGNERIVTPNRAVLDYLFGDPETEEKRTDGILLSALSLVRVEKGLLSLPEVMSITGLAPNEAQEYLDELLVRYTGDPTVTSAGGLVYRFAELMRTTVPTDAPPDYRSLTPPLGRSRGGSGDAAKRKRRILTVVNFTNLLFSVYYGVLSVRMLIQGRPAIGAVDRIHPGITFLFNAIYSFASGSALPYVLPVMFCLLGVVPFGIASLFFALHRRSTYRRSAKRRANAEYRLRREVYAQVFSHPAAVDPQAIRVSSRIRRGPGTARSVAKIVDELAAFYHAEIDDDGDGHYVYHFAELEHEELELARLRAATDPSQFAVGRVVFETRDNGK